MPSRKEKEQEQEEQEKEEEEEKRHARVKRLQIILIVAQRVNDEREASEGAAQNEEVPVLTKTGTLFILQMMLIFDSWK